MQVNAVGNNEQSFNGYLTKGFRKMVERTVRNAVSDVIERAYENNEQVSTAALQEIQNYKTKKFMGIKEQIAVMQAFAEGKKIEIRDRYNKEWSNIEDPTWDWVGFDYRIKPEPKFRPYAFEELQAEMTKGKITVKHIDASVKRIYTIAQVFDDDSENEKIRLSDWRSISYKQLLRDYQWLDGSPCGVIEE